MGAEVPQQAINARLVDEILISLVPVLLGEGQSDCSSTSAPTASTWNARA
jgi:dihydrofolate reductase